MRTYTHARTSLDKFQFAQTEHGSFVFNIDVRVADEENEQDYLPEVVTELPESPEHKIVKRIQTAIEGSYCLSILKSADGDPNCNHRFFYEYDAPIAGTGHFIHT